MKFCGFAHVMYVVVFHYIRSRMTSSAVNSSTLSVIGVDGVAHRGDWPDRGSWCVRRLPPLGRSRVLGVRRLPSLGGNRAHQQYGRGAGARRKEGGGGGGRGDEGKGKTICIFICMCLYIHCVSKKTGRVNNCTQFSHKLTNLNKIWNH